MQFRSKFLGGGIVAHFWRRGSTNRKAAFCFTMAGLNALLVLFWVGGMPDSIFFGIFVMFNIGGLILGANVFFAKENGIYKR
jgi:hypothetical protein